MIPNIHTRYIEPKMSNFVHCAMHQEKSGGALSLSSTKYTFLVAQYYVSQWVRIFSEGAF